MVAWSTQAKQNSTKKTGNRKMTEEDVRKVRRKIVKGPLYSHEDLNLTLQTVKNPQGF